MSSETPRQATRPYRLPKKPCPRCKMLVPNVATHCAYCSHEFKRFDREPKSQEQS